MTYNDCKNREIEVTSHSFCGCLIDYSWHFSTVHIVYTSTITTLSYPKPVPG